MRRGCVVVGVALAAALVQAPHVAHAEVVWLCKPGMVNNPCEIPQDTTIQHQGQADEVVTPEPGPREVDCFYVYPTVSNQTTPNADKSRDPELESVAKYQAARFSLQCRVFAPIYRQGTLAALTAGMAGGGGADRELAYSDVVEAWREYLGEENDGRGVVLVGHSQGTFMLRWLLSREIEQNPAQHRLLVSGLLLGGDVEVAEGKLIGGDFARTPLCTREAQVGCVVAFSTFAEDPPSDSRFGTTTTEGREVACTDLRPLAGWKDPLRILTPSEPFAPGPIQAGIVVTSGGAPPSAETTWVTPPDRFEGTCRTINGANVLRLEPTPGSRTPNYYPDETWGTHLIDVNVALDPLVQLVLRQAARWTDPAMKLRRRCTDAGLRLRLAGRDAAFASEVVFRLGKRRVARDKQRPFKATVAPSTLEASSAKKVRASVRLRRGEPEKLTLTRRAPSCGS
jgi:pimeloyl-ACP methyl ester carboxylesterase